MQALFLCSKLQRVAERVTDRTATKTNLGVPLWVRSLRPHGEMACLNEGRLMDVRYRL